MDSGLYSRINKLKTIAMMEIHSKMGIVELLNYWNEFLSTIPKDATFEDLDRATQNKIRKWETMLELRKDKISGIARQNPVSLPTFLKRPSHEK